MTLGIVMVFSMCYGGLVDSIFALQPRGSESDPICFMPIWS